MKSYRNEQIEQIAEQRLHEFAIKPGSVADACVSS